MKNFLKKAMALCLTFVMTSVMWVSVGAPLNAVSTAPAVTTNDYYNTYTSVASIADRSSCTAMQGLAVGSTWLYTVKIKSDNSSAVLQKTNKNTGATTNLTDSSGSATYSYLNHANDMDVATVDGYSNLYIATMATGSNSLVRMKIDGSKATKAGSYTIMLNGAEKSVSAVSVLSTTDTDINFLFKVGAQFYKGSVAKSATSGTINITPAFKINTSSVKVNGTVLDLSSYTHQGLGYYDGKIFVPLWGGGASKSNVAIIAVYDVANASGTITSDPYLSFRITSSAYSGFEIESCDISSDGKLYFNANRWTSSSGNYDGVFCFDGYKYGNNPDGFIETVKGEARSVSISGWAFDKDDISQALEIQVYIGGEQGDSNAECHSITADVERTDVGSAYSCGNYHGFDETILTTKQGTQSVYVYAVNVRGGENICLGYETVDIIDENNPPTISDVTISEVSTNGYRVTCKVTDDSKIVSAKFSVWTQENGQDDIVWYDAVLDGDTATCYISASEHNNEIDDYITHIYAYDICDNYSVEQALNVTLTDEPIEISSTEYNFNTYTIYNSGMTWAEAKEWCESHSGHLATVTSADEWNVVKSLLENYNGTRCWLGAESTDGVWKWVTGEVFDFTNWADGQPDCANNSEFYLGTYDAAGLWNDYTLNGDKVGGFICEFEQLIGDVNGDRVINIRDVTELQKFIVGYKNGIIEANADVNFDEVINIRDATEIQKYIVGMIDGFKKPEDSGNTETPTTEPPTEPTTPTVTYFPACDSSYSTLITALESVGADSSYAYRATIAAANGITDYSGTAEQNTQMLNLLKQGKLIVPSDSETEPTEPTTPAVTYFPACSSSYTSLVSALESVGADSSYAYRTTIAAANGITDYSGTAEQNTQMLNLLKQGKLIVP